MDRAVADVNRRQFLAGAMAGSALMAGGSVVLPSLLHAASGLEGDGPPALTPPPITTNEVCPRRAPLGKLPPSTRVPSTPDILEVVKLLSVKVSPEGLRTRASPPMFST